MAESAISSTRLPRGTKPVAQAFLAALDALPEVSRSAVAKAAQAMIRDELKTRRDKQRKAPARASTKASAQSAQQPVKSLARKARSSATTEA
jgi:hypothetical protein